MFLQGFHVRAKREPHKEQLVKLARPYSSRISKVTLPKVVF